MEKSIDEVLELQQRDKMMMQLGSIEKAVNGAKDSIDMKFVPLEESRFDHVASLLNTSRLCLDAAGKEFDKWLAVEEGAANVIPEYTP